MKSGNAKCQQGLAQKEFSYAANWTPITLKKLYKSSTMDQDGYEFEQAPGVGDRQGSLVCCSPWGHKESDMTEHLN